MARLKYNGLRATLGGTGLTNVATAVTFGAALTHSNGTAVPTLAAGDYIPLVILDSANHESEIVWLTAYTSGATTGTIARGKEGTTAAAHASGDTVICSPTALDSNFAGVKVYRSAAYSLVTSTITAVPWDAEEYDTDGFHDNVTNNTRLTVPTGLAGKYTVRVNVGVDLTGNSFNRFIVSLRKNGTVIRGGNVESNFSTSAAPMLAVSVDVDLADGDYVDATYFQDSGGSRNFYNAQCAFSMYRIG